MKLFKEIRKHPSYKWVVVGACFAMIMVCLGFCSSSKSLYLKAMTEALSLERSLFSVNDSIRYVATALVNLFFGSLVLRVGPRKMIAGGFVCLMASMMIDAVAESLPMFYLGGALLGIGQSWTSTTIVGYVVGLWCRENKGTIMGAVLAANGIGTAITTQVIRPIINASTFGYRTAYHITTVILLVVGLLVVLLFKDRPEEPSAAPSGNKKTRGGGWQGLTLEACLKKPYFYMILLCVFFTGVVIQSTAGIYVAHMEDVGIDGNFITTVATVYALCITATKFLTGVLYDRLGLRVTLLICNIASAVAMVLLAALTPELSWLAMVFGIAFAIGVPLETIMLPLITADMFGDRDSARILGILVSAGTAGYAVGTPVVNLFYDQQGTYQTVLLLMGGVMAAVTVLSILALNASQKLKNQLSQV